MNAECLLAQYDLIADAPDTVAALRRFVLDLAVRGKLVAQSREDVTPVKQLKQARTRLEQAAAKTNRLRWKHSAEIADADVDKAIPAGWVAARVNDTGLYINGLPFKPSDWKRSGLPIIRIQNLTDSAREFNYTEGKFSDEVLVRDGDLLVSWSATLEAFKWDRGPAVLNQHIFKVIPDEGLTTRDFLLLLLRHAIREMADSEHAHGLVMTHINRGPFLDHIVLLPPIAEQRRIVAKVDELMASCDRLEAARLEREVTRDRFTASSLARLNMPDSTNFQADARFMLDNLRTLTTQPSQIKLLRQTVLNLAVRGKLVPQSAGDQPSKRLLEKVSEQQRRTRRENVVTMQGEAEPFAIPTTWEWATLDQLIIAKPQNGLSPKPTNRESAPKAITLTATTSGVFNPAHFKHVEANVAEDSEYWLVPGDLLFQRGNTRDYVGMAALYDGPPKTFLFPDLMIRVRVSPNVDVGFVHLAAVAPPSRKFFSQRATGAQATMPKINQTTLASLPIPLPPLDEQRRIVAKVDELMTLCDRLESNLKMSDETRRHSLEALLHEVLVPRVTTDART